MPKFHKKTLASLIRADKFNRRLSVMEGIALGEQAMHAGLVYSQAEAKRRLAKWLSSNI
ncbi:MAG TPA: hypothetical protein VK785_01935 [Opitutaceae bacterium]|jgi:hypothetical protein|nr:hypothetical protein [Opitutaceae bacterium]